MSNQPNQHTDVERAKGFLEKHGPVSITDYDHLCSTCDHNDPPASFVRFDPSKESPPTEQALLDEFGGFEHASVAVAILEYYLREQLRDGGKNFVNMVDTVKFAKVAVKTVVQSNPAMKGPEVNIITTGQSDLHSLILAFEQMQGEK